MTYDSRSDTLKHIGYVRDNLRAIVNELRHRADCHDRTKLEQPEKAAFDEFTPKLRGVTYGSTEYHELLDGLDEALEHHYAHNRHHPEHHERGIADMNLLDLAEMLADWQAATLRHDDGDLAASIRLNATRFAYGTELQRLLTNTAQDLGWI